MSPGKVIKILEFLMAECTRRFDDKEKKLKIETWYTQLLNVADEQGDIGLGKALDDDMEFMPSVGKFKQMCLSVSGCHDLEGEAIKAWGFVISNLNYSSSPIFKDSCIPEAIRGMGGWRRTCQMLEEAAPFRKKEFIELYVIARRKNKDFNPMLSGDSEFLIGGKRINNHKMIGYESKKEEVLALGTIRAKRIEERQIKKITDKIVKITPLMRVRLKYGVVQLSNV